MSSIRNRFLVILALVLASVWALYPRTVTLREFDRESGAYTERQERRVPLPFGLDLQGGVHLALEIDETQGVVADREGAIERALTVVRNRVDEFGTAEAVVQQVGTDRIIVELPGVDNTEHAISIVQRSAFLEMQITDRTQALERALPRMDQVLRQRPELAAAAGAPAQPERPTAIGQLFTPGTDTAAVPGDTSLVLDTADVLAGTVGPLSRLIQPGGMPGEYFVASADVPRVTQYLAIPEVAAALPPARVLRWGAVDPSLAPGLTPLYVLEARPIITGEFITDARPSVDPVDGNVVSFTLSTEGGRRFRRETGANVGNYMAIVLDQRVMGRPPVIQSAIGTRGQITLRGRNIQEANDLALVLRAGALPVALQVVEAQRIGPSLGADAIENGWKAGLLGVVLVLGIMVAYYRFAGVLAVMALSLYGLFTLAILAGFNATLTLPGIAGFVLSIGIAVDANVLIFERIREELGLGRSVRAAIDNGFKQALSAIVDSNVTTALTAIILYQFGTGPVRGFAVTLLAGIIASMISAIFVVRTFLLLWMQRQRGAQTLSI
jgi:preprotein translocase subunit SecD